MFSRRCTTVATVALANFFLVAILSAQPEQPGVVLGSVFERGQKTSVVGAAVSIEGVPVTATTDGFGRFEILDVAAGVPAKSHTPENLLFQWVVTVKTSVTRNVCPNYCKIANGL